VIVSLSVSDDKQPVCMAPADTEETEFSLGVIRIRDRDFKRVTENRSGLGERNTVLLKIARRLC
jgi:hypothetical protein